jgi:hypothetical protein
LLALLLLLLRRLQVYLSVDALVNRGRLDLVGALLEANTALEGLSPDADSDIHNYSGCALLLTLLLLLLLLLLTAGVPVSGCTRQQGQARPGGSPPGG